MYNYKYFVSFAALAFASRASCLSVTPSNDANALAKALLGDGITLVSATYSGAADGSGLYTNGPLGIRDSIVLTTGNAVDVIPGDSTGGEISRSKGTSGNDLCRSLNGGTETYDAAVLSMNVILEPTFRGFFSEFIFTTEEYPEWVGSNFHDVFGIFIDGKQIAHDTNNDAVTVNGPSFGSGSVLTPPASGSNMDGSTPILGSGYLASPGPHKIDIAICDTADSLLDSAVFVTLGACTGKCTSGTAISSSSSPTTAPCGLIIPSPTTTVSSSAAHKFVTTTAPVSSIEPPCVTYTSYIVKTVTKCDSGGCHYNTTVAPTVVTSTLQLTVYTPCSTVTVSKCAGGPGSSCITYTNTVTYPAITTYPPIPTFTAPVGYPTPVFTGSGAVPIQSSAYGNGTRGCAGAYCGRPIPSAGSSIPIGYNTNLTSSAPCPNCPRSSIILPVSSSATTIPAPATKPPVPTAIPAYTGSASHAAGMTSAVVLGFIVAMFVVAGV